MDDSVLLRSLEASSDAIQDSLIDYHLRQTPFYFQYCFLPLDCKTRLDRDLHGARTSFINHQVAPFHFYELSESRLRALYGLLN